MKTKTVYNYKGEEITLLGFRCPYCGHSYCAEPTEIEEFDTYICPHCLDDVYFEDAGE